MTSYLKGNQKNLLFGVFFLYHAVSAVYNYFRHSHWIFDNFAIIGLLIVLYVLTEKLYVGTPEFLLINTGFLLHTFGNFGAYAWSYGLIGYDNIEHFIFPFALAYLVFNFVVHRFKIIDFKKHEHKAVFILFVFGIVAFISILHEFVEFFGYVFLPPGDGVFFTGVGDGVGGADIYFDTMTDLLSNMVGAIIGVMTYYYVKLKK